MTEARTTVPCARCGHQREAHEHYRRGSDCAVCDCPSFADRRGAGYTRESGRLRRALHGLLGRRDSR